MLIIIKWLKYVGIDSLNINENVTNQNVYPSCTSDTGGKMQHPYGQPRFLLFPRKRQLVSMSGLIAHGFPDLFPQEQKLLFCLPLNMICTQLQNLLVVNKSYDTDDKSKQIFVTRGEKDPSKKGHFWCDTQLLHVFATQYSYLYM